MGDALTLFGRNADRPDAKILADKMGDIYQYQLREECIKSIVESASSLEGIPSSTSPPLLLLSPHSKENIIIIITLCLSPICKKSTGQGKTRKTYQVG